MDFMESDKNDLADLEMRLAEMSGRIVTAKEKIELLTDELRHLRADGARLEPVRSPASEAARAQCAIM